MDAWQQALVDEVGADAIDVLARVCHGDDAKRAQQDFRRFLDEGRRPATIRQLREDPIALDLLLRLGSASRYGFDTAARSPGLFWGIVQERQFRQVWGRQLLQAQLDGDLHGCDEFAHKLHCLARFKQHHYLRLILSDISDSLGFEAIVLELSDMADAITQAAVLMARDKLRERFGEMPVRFTVLAMGKLGGRELNYSSDIDLIFIYEAPTATDDGPDFHGYCQKLGAEIVNILDQVGEHGRLFRVDMRLRPEGDKGELALSLRETVDYYYSVGRSWERQAMIKARPVGGDIQLGERFLEELRPWVYPKDKAWEDLDSTRAMRRRIEDKGGENNVKTGPGGIRDIEFLAQFFQLSHGGRIPELRSRASLPTLRALADHGILPPEHGRELEDHYLWLRTVEHRLQMWEDRQVHDLPTAPDERASLARRCGAPSLQEFDAKYQKVRGRVRALADHHYLRASRHEDEALALLAEKEVDDALIDAVIGRAGFKDKRKAADRIRDLAVEPFFVLHRSRTERSLAAILPALLWGISQSPSPDATLENFAKIAAAVGGRATFYELLGGAPRIMRLFVDLAGWSTFLVSLLNEFPGLPDDLVDSLNQPMHRADALLREARSLVQGLREIGEPLRYFQARELASTAVRDLEGLPQNLVNRQLSNLATAILTVAQERCTAERAREWGLPMESSRMTRFAILGLGKFGSKELSYASDMDVIFVCDPGGTCLRNQKSGEEFWTRVAQDVMRIITEGRLYAIDPRLRPWGEQGELVSNLTALRLYWQQPRDMWERMAMLRVSHIAGDPTLGNECVALIRDTAISAPLPANAAAEVRDMRKRLEESVAGRDHLKRGPGGYVDHEFIAHYLSFGADPRQLPAASSISETLRHLGNGGRMPAEAVKPLSNGLDLLRFIEARMRLTAGKAVSSIPQKAEERTELARRCDYPGLAEFDLALHLARESARRWFDHLVK